MLRALCLVLSLVLASPALAHPHVFVDVTLRFQADAAGRLTAVEVEWAYDDLFSLLLLSERGLDGDGDGVLSDAERDELEGFDLADWPDWFEGATFVYHGDRQVALGPPEPLGLTLKDGRIVTRHLRRFDAVHPGGVIVRPYDPSYYAALRLAGVEGLPGACKTEVVRPDADTADARAAAQSSAEGEAFFQEVRVGIYYADTLVLTCG